MRGASTVFTKATELIEKQQAKIESLRDEFDGMRRHATTQASEIEMLQVKVKAARLKHGEYGIGLAAADVVRKRLQDRIDAGDRACENLKYKLQLYRDEITRMAEAVNINDAEITRLKRELEAAKEQTDPYYEARFRNECAKTQGLSTKLWEQDGELERYRTGEASLRAEYDGLYAMHQKALELLHRYQNQEDDILTMGLHDLNVRVVKLEAMHEWDEANPAWDFHTEGAKE